MLTDDQLAASTCYEHSLILAIPGSGKTHVLVELAINLLALGKMVVVITFTRQAAAELRERLAKSEHYNPKKAIVGTFHSVAYKQLKKSSLKGFLLSPEHQKQFQKRAYDKHYKTNKNLKEFYSYCDKREANISQPSHSVFSSAFKKYRDMVKSHGAITVNDIIPMATKAMEDSGANFFDAEHLLMDEIQDCDPLQIDWALQFANTLDSPQVHGVGDDDQSIYGFRNSSGYKAIKRLEDELGAGTYVLSLNFRSHAEVLRLASNLIGYNYDRVPKVFNSNLGDGGKVEVHSYKSDDEEMEAMVSHVRDLPKPVAILARSNIHLQEYSEQLTRFDVEHVVSKQDSIFNTYEAYLFKSILSLLLAPNMASITNLLYEAGVDDETLSSSLGFSGNQVKLNISSIPQHLKSPIMALISLTRLSGKHDLVKAPETAIQAAYDWLDNYCEDSPTLKALLNITKNKVKGDLRSRLSFMESKSDETDHDVQLLSMHGSKGRQYKSVVIPKMVQGNIPSEKSGELSDIEEERRLCFVALTRAIENLVFTYSSQTPSGRIRSPSQFLTEMANEAEF